MVDEDLKRRFTEYLTKCDETYLEYEEKHGDAGAAYTHCVVESWQNGYAKRTFIDYVKEHIDCTQGELAELVKRFDAWSFEMEPSHIFGCSVDPDKGIVIDSYDLGEVENQHEVNVIAEELECEPDDVRELVKQAKAEHDFCIGSIYRDNFETFETYQATDAVWMAVVPRSWIDDTLDEIRTEAENAAEQS